MRGETRRASTDGEGNSMVAVAENETERAAEVREKEEGTMIGGTQSATIRGTRGARQAKGRRERGGEGEGDAGKEMRKAGDSVHTAGSSMPS